MRVAVCVGCDGYDHLSPLHGAANDATRVHASLVKEDCGAYDPSSSALLISPSASDFKAALGNILFSGTPVDVFTLFFAGHAAISFETLYLAFRDTDSLKLPLTGYSFSELVRAVVSARPAQANFVLDACNSGGLGYDLATILRASLLGTAESTGVSFLAAAAADQVAWEVSGGGAFSRELLRALSGELLVQTSRPFLDLSEIGAVLDPKTPPSAQQTVSRWALNVQGVSRFVKNPHYVATSSAATNILSKSVSRRLSRADVQAVNRLTVEVAEEVNEVDIAQTVELLAREYTPDEATDLVLGLNEGLVAAAAESADSFAEARIRSTMLGQLARLSKHSELARDQLHGALSDVATANMKAVDQLRIALRSNKNALLTPGDALSDLLFLPYRLADLLGRIGSLLLFGGLNSVVLSELEHFCDQILSMYGNSVLAVADDQAAPYCMFLSGCLKQGWIKPAEEVIGRLFSDLVANFGRVARPALEANDAVRLLRSRYKQPFEFDGTLYQSPFDLATVVLLFGAFFDLDEAIDYDLILLDHTALNFFIPDDVWQLGAVGPLAGRNVSFVLGHGIWRCVDLRREWSGALQPLLLNQHVEDAGLMGAIAHAALAFRDRVAWHPLAGMHPLTREPFCRVTVLDS